MPTPNQRVSEYVLVEKIGGGTFGEVWKAHHHVWTDQLVAIKIPTDGQYVRNLQREGAAIHGLVHPNIVRAMGFDPYGDPAYLTMEYVPGSSLRPLIKDKKLNIDQSIAVMKQVLAGLEYAHNQGIVHRDIKPENILIHERAAREGFGVDGLVKVTDFGLGRAATSTAVGSIVYSASLNDAAGKEIAGTLDYMAPEQRSGGDSDRRADLYACGVVLYELLTGERPAGTDLPSDLNPKVPRWLDEVFKRAYTRLDKRFASAMDFSKAMSAAEPPPIPRQNFQHTGYQQPPIVPGPVAPVTGGRTTCPHCRQQTASDDNFCMHCGVQLVSHVRRCNKCGAYPDPRDRYCILCGEEMSTPAKV
jgi:serine/threonine protein kinase